MKLIRGGTFPQLREELLRDLGRRGDDPLAPVWVVAPTATAANELRLGLCRRSGESGLVAGARVETIGGWLRRLAWAVDVPPGQRRGPLFDLLLLELGRRLPKLELSARLGSLRGGHRLLMPTFLDLADGGFGPDHIEVLLELARDRELKTVEREMLALYCGWLDLLDESEVAWLPLQAQKIASALDLCEEEQVMRALGGERGQAPQVWFHGFYDFTDVNLQIACAASRLLDTRLYFPALVQDGKTHPAFASVEGLLEELGLRLGRSLGDAVDLGGEGSPPAEYFSNSFPEGEAGPQPDFLSLRRACGLRAEALAAASRVRAWLDEDPSLAPHEILIAAPSPEAYLPHLREAFQAFALPLRALGVPGDPPPEVRALRSLGRLWRPEAPAEAFFDFLRQRPHLMEGQRAFEEKARQTGLWGGEAWSSVAGENGFDADEHQWAKKVRDLARSASQSHFAPAEAIGLLERMQNAWLPREPLLQPLLKALEHLRERTPELEIPLESLQDLITERLEEPNGDPWNREAVLFTPLMRSRGLEPRRLVLLGLSSRHLPMRVEEDPLLTDASRRRLLRAARDLGHRLPIKSQAVEEQMLLFYLLNTSAEKLHWVIPESDESGRRVAPSPWVQRYLDAWESQEAARTLPRGPREQARFLLDADEGGGMLPPRYAALLGRPGLRATSALGADPPVPVQPPDSLKVTPLERLARCPFRYYGEFVARWQTLPILEPVRELHPIDRGRVLHEALESLLRTAVSEQAPLSAASRQALREGAAAVDHALQNSLRRLYSDRVAPHALLSQAFAARLRERLVAYLRQLEQAGDATPVRLEFTARRDFPGLRETEVRGRLDRVDDLEFSGRRIVDYKAGKKPRWGEMRDDLGLGFRLQPTLYPWLWESSKAGPAPGFAYVFLGESPPRTETPRAGETAPAEELLASLRPSLERGAWPALSNEACAQLDLPRIKPCQYCNLASACRRHAPGAPSRLARAFAELAPERLQFMRQRLEE